MDAPTSASLKTADINHISKFANSTLEEVEIEESMVQRVMQTIHDKLKKEGGAAGFDDIAKEVKKEFGITLQKSSLDNMPGVKKHRDGDYILEADLSKSQVKMVHKKADDMSKKDFVKRYGKDGDSVRFATATNMVKKELGIEEEQYVPEQTQPKGEEVMNESYKDKFNATMKKFGINSLGDLKSDEEKKKLFKAVDNAHVAKDEELEEGFSSDAQRKAAFASGYKEKGKKKDEMMKMKKEEDAYDNERFIIIDGKAKKDDGNTPDKKDHVYAPDAKTALQLHKQGKKVYRESVDPSCPICEGEACQCAQSPSDTESVSEMAMNAMKMNAMKMPIRATYGKMNAMKTGDDDMTPMNNMKLNAMVKDPHKSKKDDPKKDMNAGYMKSDVRADVKNNGGADMAKVKDKPQMMPAMKKINAMYKTEKYLDEKEGSIQNTVAQMFEAENRLVEVQDKNLEKMIADYLKKGGTITKLPPALAKGMKASGQSTFKVGDKGIIKSMYRMKEVREFVDTYNRHFLLNYKAEELINNEV